MSLDIKLSTWRYAWNFWIICFPTHQHNNIGNHIVVPGVMNSLGLSKQPMKLALLNLVPPVPYTYTNIFDIFISNIF